MRETSGRATEERSHSLARHAIDVGCWLHNRPTESQNRKITRPKNVLYIIDYKFYVKNVDAGGKQRNLLCCQAAAGATQPLLHGGDLEEDGTITQKYTKSQTDVDLLNISASRDADAQCEVICINVTER